MKTGAGPMAETTRKHNPGFLSNDELTAIFCVRTAEYQSLIEALRECSGSANTHQIVIGPRGSGKTSLLLRVAAEIGRDADLRSRFFPVVFAEESYEVSTAGEFWLECLFHLADQAPHRDDGVDLLRTFEELRTIHDDRTLEDRCLGVLQDFADREHKRLVLIAENLNMMFTDMGDDDAGWRLRKVLQTEPRIILLASATRMFKQMADSKEALYELFRVIQLHPLDMENCAHLWQTVSGQAQVPQTIQALRILTGGSPRLLTIVARFGAHLSFHELMADLLDLVDDHTEYFKSHLDALPAQERKVYLALADLWKPAHAREIANRARLGTSQCSAQLARLVDKGVVEVSGGSARRKLYYLTERLCNIYYLMRRSHGPTPQIDALIRFMEAYYSTEELKKLGVRMAEEVSDVDEGASTAYRTTLGRLAALPSLTAHREEMLLLASATTTEVPAEHSSASPKLSTDVELLREALALMEKGQLKAALVTCEEAMDYVGESNAPVDSERIPLILFYRGIILSLLGIPGEALAVWDDVVQRFDEKGGRSQTLLVVRALVCKGGLLRDLGLHTEALATYDEVLERFRKNDAERLGDQIAAAMVERGCALASLNRMDETLNAWHTLAKQFRSNDSPEIAKQIATARMFTGRGLYETGRLEEALTAYEGVLQGWAADETPESRRILANCFLGKGIVLHALERRAEADASWDEAHRCFEGTPPDDREAAAHAMMAMTTALLPADSPDVALKMLSRVVNRFETDDQPGVLAAVANALWRSGTILEQAGRYKEALRFWEQIEERFGTSEVLECQVFVARSFMRRSINLFKHDRLEEAVACSDRAVGLLSQNTDPEVLQGVSGILVNKGIMLYMLLRNEEALAAWGEVNWRFGSREESSILKRVAAALINTGALLEELGRPDEAIEAWNEVVRRFDTHEALLFQESIALAIVSRAEVLILLDRPDEAIEDFNEAVRRFGSSNDPRLSETVARALLNKADLFFDLERAEEALMVWKDIVRRFEASDVPILRDTTGLALCRAAECELCRGRAPVAIALLDPVILPEQAGSIEIKLLGQLMRARAHMAEGDPKACARDAETVLRNISEHRALPLRDLLESLLDLAEAVGPKKMCDLMGSSPDADVVLPLKTALELDAGLEPRVAREVEEIAKDIRQDMLNRQKAGPRRRHAWPFGRMLVGTDPALLSQ